MYSKTGVFYKTLLATFRVITQRHQYYLRPDDLGAKHCNGFRALQCFNAAFSTSVGILISAVIPLMVSLTY